MTLPLDENADLIPQLDTAIGAHQVRAIHLTDQAETKLIVEVCARYGSTWLWDSILRSLDEGDIDYGQAGLYRDIPMFRGATTSEVLI